MTFVTSHGREPMTFRDPAGSVFRRGERIFRAVNPRGNKDLTAFLQTATAMTLLASGNLVSTTEVSLEAAAHDLLALAQGLRGDYSLYEHSPVWFPSYPYEWPAEMLFSAARLTLDIAESALEEGFGLKDATPFNILFDRARPVFVDICSFEQREPSDPLWLACGQFERMFLLPLLASRFLGLDPHFSFSGNLDGPDVETLSRCFRFPANLHPTILQMVTLPRLFGKIAETEAVRAKLHTNRAVPPETAKTLLRRLFRDLRSKLESVRPTPKDSAWSEYAPDADEARIKAEVVNRTLTRTKAGTVVDIGCNTGTYSRIAAKTGATVVALDSDSTVAGQVWLNAEAQNLDILPLAVDISRPTPGMGWRNSEYRTFESRAESKFDAALMLAVLHHIVVNGRIPLEQLFETIAGYAKRTLILEFVSNRDPMFLRISRGRESLFLDHTEQNFEHCASQHFELTERHRVSNTRTLYVLTKR